MPAGRSIRRETAKLQRLQQAKQGSPADLPSLGPELITFFKQSVQKRQTKLTQIAECWSTLVPALFNDHCALESLNKGNLTVVVDSASHLYELRQLLLAGLEKQLLLTCKSAGLRKILLKHGRWYDSPDPSDRRPKFD